ncbi:MAG: hypothetical protein AB1742_03650 [bacterium]
MRKTLFAAIVLFTLSAAAAPVRAKTVLETDERISAIREEAESLVLIQSVLSWYSRTQGEESILELTYRGHEGLFRKENALYIEKLLSEKGGELSGEERRALKFLRDYVAAEYIGLDTAHFDDEINNAEAEAKVTVDFMAGEIAYRDLNGLLDNEKDPDNRKKLQAAQASVWEKVLNPIHERMEERVRELAVEFGYSDYVAMSEELRWVNLKELIRVSQEYISESDALYRGLLEKEVREVMGFPLEKFSRSDIGYFAQVPYFTPYFPAELVVPAFRYFIEGIGLDLTTAAGTQILIDEEKRPKKHPRAACYSIRVPRDIRVTVKPSSGVPDFETFFHEGGHALHFGNTAAGTWEFQELGNNAVTEAYAIFFENMWGNPGWLNRYRELVRDYNRLIAPAGAVPELTDADVGKLLRNRAFWNVYFVRRYNGAKLLYESILHGGDESYYRDYYKGQTEDLQEVYRALFSDAYGFALTPADALRFRTDVDAFFYSADYARAFFLAAQLEEGLEKMFGGDWFENPAAGKFLREKLWATGNMLQADEVARELGYGGVDAGAFRRRVERMLKQSGDLMKEGAGGRQ